MCGNQPTDNDGTASIEISDQLEDEINGLIKDGFPISAIKRLREETGLGLKGAKVYVDARIERIVRPTIPCPYCGKDLRTDKAKQCLECGMDWHDPNNVIRRGEDC